MSLHAFPDKYRENWLSLPSKSGKSEVIDERERLEQVEEILSDLIKQADRTEGKVDLVINQIQSLRDRTVVSEERAAQSFEQVFRRLDRQDETLNRHGEILERHGELLSQILNRLPK